MSQADHDLIRAGIERRLAAVESLIPSRPTWRAVGDHAIRIARFRVVAGPALRQRPRGDRRVPLLLVAGAAIGLLLAYGLLGGGGPPNLLPADTPTPTALPGALRPLIEPRLTVPVRPRTSWTVVEDRDSLLGLVYLLEDVGSGGYHVGLMIVEPHGVYDPVAEDPLLPLPADLMGWIRDHPDLESDEPFALTVAGLPASAIDVTVTYRSDGPKGQTAQFIDIGGPWNLEYPSRKRIVLLTLPDRPLLVVFDSRPEFFQAGIGPFEDELAQMRFEVR
ncbi:MAG TPA: hypothetical protein VEX41_09510 [Candidatus Eisenbacteria bacterium]|nr:hypothetical protein [Candidatus Eisenbacteria bacterium]